MTAFPTPGGSDVWGANLNAAIKERVPGVDNPDEWGSSLGYDEEFNTAGASLPSGWAWPSGVQGTATYVCAKGRGIVTEPTAAAGNQLRFIDRAIPTESSFEAVFKLRARMYPTGTTYGGFVCLRDSVGGKVVAFGPGGTPSIDLWNWNSATSLNGTLDAVATNIAFEANYWKLKKNSATSWDFQLSSDGVVWDTVRAAHNVQTFLGTTPTHIGFGLWRNNQVVSVACDWFRVR